MTDPTNMENDEGGAGPGEDLGVPRRPRLPVVSLALAVVFLAAGVVLLCLVRTEVAYFFASSGPEQRFVPTRERPVPADAKSNVFAEARIDPANLCDFWDPTVEAFRPDESYAFTLKMGIGNVYFMTCAGDGQTRPRLWILKPETEAESAKIHEEAVRRRLARTTFQASTEGPVPEVHVPGGGACVNDLCRGRLVRFSDYARNVFAGVGNLRETLAERLSREYGRTGIPPLGDDDFLFILGETPRSNWWYIALVGVIVVLSLLNLTLAARFLVRYSRARREIRTHLAQATRAQKA